MEVNTAVPTYKSIQNGRMPPVSAVEKGIQGNKSGSTASYKFQYRVYKWRWFMLLTVCLLNISNGMMWLSFAPIPNYTASFYHITVDLVDWFSIIYFILSLVFGLISIVLLDKLGLKIPLYIGATLNLIGSALRLVSTINPIVCSSIPMLGFWVALIGQGLTAIAQPFALYSPTTLAAVWFGPKERGLATNFASVANPIGLAVAQLAAPLIVTSVEKVPMMLWIFTIPAGLTFLLTIVAFWWKEPPIPPAPSGNRDHIPPFFKGVLQVLKNWSFWVLLIFWGGAAGLFNALLTLLPQILCPYGYSDRDSGLWGALMIFCGLVGATIAGIIIDYTKKFKEVSVISVAFSVLCFVWFMEVYPLLNQNVTIAISLCFFGFFALALIPVCMELGVEITYPVAESISSGLLWSAAQVLGIVIVFISQALETPMNPALISIQQCSSDFDADASNGTGCTNLYNATDPVPIVPGSDLVELGPAMIFCPTVTAVLYVFYVACFHPEYKRIKAEKRASFEESIFVGDSTQK